VIAVLIRGILQMISESYTVKHPMRQQRWASKDGLSTRAPPCHRDAQRRRNTIGTKTVPDDNGFSLGKFKSWSFIVTVILSGLIGAAINNGFDISRWLILEWLETDRERVSVKSEIAHTLLQIEKLDKAILENRVSHVQDKDALKKELDSLKHHMDSLRSQLSRIEYRVNWFHAPGGGEERRDLEEFREWQRQQERKHPGQWEPED
jgi:hypothetical protein